MQDAQIPAKIPIIWGASAAPGLINPIPTLSQQGVINGAASFTDGFPPLCFIALSAGGAGPFGKDFNGILNQVTANIQWNQAGGPWPYDPTFVSNIGGYPRQAMISSAATPGLFWISTADNNSNNPDAGGANWIPAYLNTTFQSRTYSTAGTFSFQVPPGVYVLLVRLVGGGGGGAGAGGASTWSGGGGGSGGYCEGYVSVTPGQIISIIVGAGGNGSSQGNGVTANSGGTTSFGPFMSATGGGGGSAGTGTSSGGGPGLGSGASILNFYGSNGGDGNITTANSQGGYGASSAFGGGGRTSTLAVSITNGLAPGSGGGGIWLSGAGNQNGGNGAPGAVIIVWSAPP